MTIVMKTGMLTVMIWRKILINDVDNCNDTVINGDGVMAISKSWL